VKQTSKKRLIIDRETVRALVVELSPGQLRYVEGGVPPTTSLTNTSNLACGCLSNISRTGLG
jgi:hypothetical protein